MSIVIAPDEMSRPCEAVIFSKYYMSLLYVVDIKIETWIKIYLNFDNIKIVRIIPVRPLIQPNI